MPARAKLYTAKLGHVRLNVQNLQRAIDFYMRFVQLDLVERGGDDYAFLSRGSCHHMVALFSAGQDLPLAAPNGTSVDHIAFEVQGKRSFARAFEALTDAGVHVTTVNNGISWSIYFRDPDGNSLEIFRDTRDEPDGQKLWQGVRQPLEYERILAALRQRSGA